jgi:lysozyme
MQISYNGLEALKQYEGFRDKAYLDTGGVWTIGFGTTRVDGKPVLPGMTCTLAHATEWLRLDCAEAQTAVNQQVRSPLTQGQFDSLVSFVYNVGVTAFQNSTMLRMLNAGDHDGAAKQFDRWVYDNGKVIPGLVSRRKLERAMFEA